MAERRAGAKSRRLGSSRRKQLLEGTGEAPATASGPGEELPWASEIVQKVQDFFRERDKDQVGFVTRLDFQKLPEEDFPCSKEELELVFDGLDAAGTGRLSTEEFTAGLGQFLSSQKAARLHRRRKTASRRVRLVLPSPALEGVESEERRHFAAFMDQLGTDNISEEQEIWQLWVKLRQDEPQLLGNLEDFLAKMRLRIQEARSKKEALEVTLNKRVAEHDKEVQQLCEALEQQIQQEKQRLEQESMARRHQHSAELQQALDASEREVRRLVTAQKELEIRCRNLRSTQQAASTENQQLEESNRVLENHLQHLHQQLQQTQGRLRTARAVVAWEDAEEPGEREVAELPGEVPVSPQRSPEHSEKFRSEMRIRLGSRSSEPKATSIHQVVWEMPPAETSLLGALPRVSSAEEDPFPELLKEERFSDQSSLLREMNEAIAALSKHLQSQAPAAPPTLAPPRNDAEPLTELEAHAAHGTIPGVLQETLPSHIGQELFEGDLKEGPGTAELRAADVTQAGASVGAGPCRAQELGTEQEKSPEEAGRVLFQQGKGTGVKELVLKVAEDIQGAPGESREAGEQALLEVEGEGWMQEKTGWEKAQCPGEAGEVALSQGEKLEAGLEPGAREVGLTAGQQLAEAELGPAAALGEHTQPLGMGLGAEADPPPGLSEKHEIKPGEHPDPEPPPWGEERMGAAQGDSVLPEVTVALGPGMLEEERVGVEAQPWGETADVNVPPAAAQPGGSSGAGAEEGDVEVPQPREAEPQPQGESVRGDEAWGGSVAAEVPLLEAAPPTNVQEGGEGTDVQPLEAESSDAHVLAEVEAALPPLSEACSPGIEQGGSGGPDVQPMEDDKLGLGLGKEMGAAAVHGEVPSPAETAAQSPGLVEQLPVKAQALELVEPEELWAGSQLRVGASPENIQGGESQAAVQLEEEAGDGEAQGECELPHEPVLDPQGAGIRPGEGAGAGVQPREEAESLSTLEEQSSDANVQLVTGVDELKQTPVGSTETDLQLLSKVSSRDTELGWSVSPDVQLLDQEGKPELVEMEAEDSCADTQLREGASLETPQEGEDCAAMQLGEEAEDGAQGQGKCELPHEPVLDPQGAGIRPGEEAGAGVQPREEAESLSTLEEQSSDANVQLVTGVDELRLTPAGSTETDLQPLRESASPGTEQGLSMPPDVQLLDQEGKPELVEMEAEDSQADTQEYDSTSLETPQEGEDCAAMQLGEEAEDGAQAQSECELPHKPVLDPQGAGIRPGEGAGAGVQPREEAESLSTLEEQSSDANVQLVTGVDELKQTPVGSTETDLQLLSKVSSSDTELGWSVAPDVQLLDQEGKPELVEMEAENSQADTQEYDGTSLETPQEGEDCAAMQLGEEAEDGAQGQGEYELPHEPVLDPQGAGIRPGEEAGAGVQPREEAESLSTLEEQSSDANVQLVTGVDELSLTPAGSMEADLVPLGSAGMLEAGQSQTLGLEAGLGAAHTTGVWEVAAGAHVSPLAEAALRPERAAAVEGPGLEAMLRALTGPDGQILEYPQMLEAPQGEESGAEDRPLDGAQGLAAVQGEMLGAGARSLVEAQSLGIEQGHDDGASALTLLASKVTLQIRTQKLEPVMQEDVLIPDVRRQLGASGQAAQSQLWEQVSAQANKVRLHTASQQPEEKPPHVMEPEQVGAGPTKPPKEQVPPAPILHVRVHREEDAGNDQLGMVLRNSSLGDAANSSIQPPKELLGEQSGDLSVGQQEKQEVMQKMSREGEPGPGVQGAGTAERARAAPRGSPKASLDPDHLYNVLFIGDSHVGKTSFLYRLHANTFNPHLTATVGLDYQVQNFVVDNKRFALRLWDSAGQERYHSITKQFFRKADGVVLMYDITSEYSFSDVRYWLSCIQEGAEDGVPVLLLGNKTDCAAERQVPVEEGERLAKEHQLMFFECSAASGHNVSESMASLVRLLKVHEDELKNKAEEVPKPPQKKKVCCW